MQCSCPRPPTLSPLTNRAQRRQNLSDGPLQAAVVAQRAQVWHRPRHGPRGACGVPVVYVCKCGFCTSCQRLPALTDVQLAPWLAVEVPDLLSRGLIVHKEQQGAAAAADEPK
jgi:hypothetical protein